MASIEEVLALINKVSEESGGNIPGLSFENVVGKMAEANPELKDALSQAPTPEDKEAIISRYAESVKPLVVEQIAVIKTSFTAVKEGIQQLIQNVVSAIATTVIPPAIGVPPVAPNPAYAMLENKQKVNSLLALCTMLLNTFLQLLTAAVKIQFEVPGAVVALLNQLVNLKKLINTIPA